MDKLIKKIAVRELIEYTLRSGDIRTTFLSSARAVDGIRAHQKVQKEAGENYQQEVSIQLSIPSNDFQLILHGRIDGVLKEGNTVIIDEIKSTGARLEDIKGDNPLHWAQVKMYAYMYCLQHDIGIIKTRLTYVELEEFKLKQFTQDYTLNVLKEFFDHVIHQYLEWLYQQEHWRKLSMKSIKESVFPFTDYRDGQKKLMSAVYKTIEEKQILFSRAPTGIGKTIATLFPSIKAMGQEKCEKIFYLTAKTIGKEVAAKTLQLLQEEGLRIKRVIITAKDKICLNTVKDCDPKVCPYANGHYDRVNFVLESMFREHDLFDRALIEAYSREHMVCPYELTLDLALFSEVIICDYNYAFDPSAMLRRFFSDGSGKYVLLIDEAHNLIDRARDMYSAVLFKDRILDLKKKVQGIDVRLYKYFNQLNKIFIDERKKCMDIHEHKYVTTSMPFEIVEALRGVIYRTEKIFKLHKDWKHMDTLLEFYFDGYDFLRKAELYDENYSTYYEKIGQNLKVKMFCIDPSENLRNTIDAMQGVVFFSATLLPINYYVQMLGGNKDSYGLDIGSPFDSSHLGLFINQHISTKYKDREASIEPIIKSIDETVKGKKGNYLVFFPSYAYMETVYFAYNERTSRKDIDVFIQESGLSEEEKEAFIARFDSNNKRSMVVFAVLGGMFSEGIDLAKDRLIGSIIVGVGLPQICYERDLIKQFFNEKNKNGFDYAYVFPGMNKVMQGAGRVIRTTEDKGIVLLIDQRFNTEYYNRLFPVEWKHYQSINRKKGLETYIHEFWYK